VVLVECPKCRHVQVLPGAECERCGIVFARFRPRAEPPTAPPAEAGAAAGCEPGLATASAGAVAAVCVSGDRDFAKGLATAVAAPAEPEADSIDQWGWLAFGIGLALALLTELIPLLRILVGHFTILVHEMGHAATGWLFGFPSIPAFDFRYGGGFTSQQDQVVPLVILVYAAFGALLWAFRSNRLSFVIVLAAALVYSALLLTPGHEMLILAMGHGSELVFATLFLHRALSGRGCYHAAERPLYAWIGFHIVLHDLRFAYGLVSSPLAREMYAEAKGGGHWMDFSRLAGEYLSVRLELVAGVFLLLCLLPPIIAVAANLVRRHWAGVGERLAQV